MARSTYNWRATIWLVIGMLTVIGAMGVFMHVIPTPWTQAQPAPILATPLPSTLPAVSAPQPTSAPTPGPQTLGTLVASQPTQAAAAVPQAQPATVVPAAQATPATAGAPAQQPTTVGFVEITAVPTPRPTSQPTLAPTVDPALAAEILPAYQHFWEVSDDALATLDDSHLSEVMDGIELVATQKSIEQLRAAGKAAVGTEDHSVTILSATPNDAVIHDLVVDHGIYVDSTTKDPLPQDQQAKPDTQIDATYQMQKIDGIWKVVNES